MLGVRPGTVGFGISAGEAVGVFTGFGGFVGLTGFDGFGGSVGSVGPNGLLVGFGVG